MSPAGTSLAEAWPTLGPRGARVRSPRIRRNHDRRPWPRWLRILVAALMLVVVTAGILSALAARYRPTLGSGSAGVTTLAYPGLPAAQGVRIVNTFGFVHQDVYIPPQRKGYTFYLFADIANYGSRAVTIESVGLPPYSALTPAGPDLYAQPSTAGNGTPAIPPATKVLHSVTLGPGGALLVAIPVRSWPCWTTYEAFATVPDFYVTYRFLFFTHTAAIPWGDSNVELIMRPPYGRPGQPNVACLK